ncbi:pyridoxal-dependent decarboxylase domain-containing protein 1-like [Pollicipes pollicipes]|uniref:pyridoxal-dependent decarboxylase domain-containing protein 1-like n=1 Tax=Pollicipes pollicipes TaxID=41117 RepID=UPI0018858DEA|nr:pyridoxal-dependent decarboxylase domain-containing protein 1-like [Pollicipes pollicipes]
MVQTADIVSDSAAQTPTPGVAMTSLLMEGASALEVMTSVNGDPGPDGAAGRLPAHLPDEGIAGQQLWTAVKELTLADAEEEIPCLSTVQQQTAVAHTCAAYATMLEAGAQRQLLDQLTSDVTSWLAQLFRQPGMSLFVPSPNCDSLVAMVRMRLHARYSSYAAVGYEALYARPPVVYVSAACRPAAVTALMTSLGLPGGAVRQVPLSAAFGLAHAMDVAQLQRMMDEDESAQKVPLLVMAHAGTPDLGHVDNLRRVTELCRERGVWCHVTGPSLAALALAASRQPPMELTLGDSLSLELGAWLEVPCLAAVTLFRGPLAGQPAGLPPPAPTLLQVMPLWTALLSLGRRGVVERIHSALALAAAIECRVTAVPKLQLLSARPGKEVAPVADIDKLLSQSVNFTVVLESLSPVVVFRYNNDAVDDMAYLDNLNSWLGQIMQRDLPEVPIQLLDVAGSGFCLRFSPLTEPCRPLEDDVLDEWAECLGQQIEILNATVHHRARFAELTAAGQLRAVPLLNWAGLGAVRYIPTHLQPLMEAGVTDSGKEDINKLNTELLTKLKSTDSAFSLGDGEDGMVCIRFGMVTMDTDVDELCSLLLDLGGQIEESSRFLETMSEMLMKGIEEANQDLRKESEDQLWQEGVLRHVPLVGTIVNWWSPSPKPAVRGRRLDLAEGVLQTTEETYKSHVQVRRSSSATAGTQHSRTSSSASASGGAPAPPTPARPEEPPAAPGIATPAAAPAAAALAGCGELTAAEASAGCRSVRRCGVSVTAAAAAAAAPEA